MVTMNIVFHWYCEIHETCTYVSSAWIFRPVFEFWVSARDRIEDTGQPYFGDLCCSCQHWLISILPITNKQFMSICWWVLESWHEHSCGYVPGLLCFIVGFNWECRGQGDVLLQAERPAKLSHTSGGQANTWVLSLVALEHCVMLLLFSVLTVAYICLSFRCSQC